MSFLWIVLKWIGIILVALLALIGMLVVRDNIRWYRKHQCRHCGGRKFQVLHEIAVSTGAWRDTLLCLQCDRGWLDSSDKSLLQPLTDEQTQRAKEDFDNREPLKNYTPSKVNVVRRKR